MKNVHYSVRSYKGWYLGRRKLDVLIENLKARGFIYCGTFTPVYPRSKRHGFLNREDRSTLIMVDVDWPSGIITDITTK